MGIRPPDLRSDARRNLSRVGYSRWVALSTSEDANASGGLDPREGRGRSSRSPAVLRPRGDHPAPLVFRRGAHAPFAVRWYGITSLFGHLRHFIASAIASEQVDSRDWMRAEGPAVLLSHVLGVLGAPPGSTSWPTQETTGT